VILERHQLDAAKGEAAEITEEERIRGQRIAASGVGLGVVFQLNAGVLRIAGREAIGEMADEGALLESHFPVLAVLVARLGFNHGTVDVDDNHLPAYLSNKWNFSGKMRAPKKEHPH